MNATAAFKRLEKLANAKATDAAFDYRTHDGLTPQYAIASALCNAAETDGVALETETYYRVALDSVCFTSAFNENPAVQAWFEQHGYRW